jgi:hypothetical protein
VTSAKSLAQETRNAPSVQKVIPKRAVACTECTRAAFFQARIEFPGGPEFIRRRANACSSHLIDIIQSLHSWARVRQLTTGGWLTVLAIDPYALPRLAALGIADPGFAFYSARIPSSVRSLGTRRNGGMSSPSGTNRLGRRALGGPVPRPALG